MPYSGAPRVIVCGESPCIQCDEVPEGRPTVNQEALELFNARWPRSYDAYLPPNGQYRAY